MKQLLHCSFFLQLQENKAWSSVCNVLEIAEARNFKLKKISYQIKKAFIISFFIFLIPLFDRAGKSFSQVTSRQDKQLILKADKAYDFGDYLTALNLYEKLYLLDSTDNETNFKLGVCNFEIKKLRANSKKYFDKVNAADFPEVNYYLGKLNHLLKDYDHAIYYFNQFKYFGGDNEYTKKEVDDLIEKCHNAMILEATCDKAIQVKNMGSTVNSKYAEYAPLIPADESFMIFTSRRPNPFWNKIDPLGDYFEDVYISKKDSLKSWLAPVILDSAINTPVHDAGTGLSADGEKLLIYRTSKDMKSGDIYESFFSDKKWSKPEPLGANVNSPEYSETSACYSPNGEIIFFSSNRPGGFGGKDLYLVRKLQNGKWGKPFNLGPKINTEYNEDAPFVNPLGNILYFSSEGHKNMGGYDIFKSAFDETGNFSEPSNLGCPVNTVDDDIFFVINTDGTKGYLSSEREGGFGLQDIYTVSFPPQNTPLLVYDIHVYNDMDSLIKNVEIKFIDTEKESVYGIYKSNDKTGKVMVISPPNKTYRVAIELPEYDPFVTNIVLGSVAEITIKLPNKTK